MAFHGMMAAVGGRHRRQNKVRLHEVLCPTPVYVYDNRAQAQTGSRPAGGQRNGTARRSKGITRSIIPPFPKVSSMVQSFAEKRLPVLLGKERTQQFTQIASDADVQARLSIARTINHNIAMSTLALGLAIAGALVYWPLNLLSAIGYVYAARRNFFMAYHSLRQGKAGIPLLVVISILGAIASGYFIVGATASLLFNLSTKAIHLITDDSRKKLVDVFRQQPKTVWMVVDGSEIEAPIEQLLVGDIVIIRAGEAVPVDGVIVQGMASIDQHILTGESQPVEKGMGEEVFATTLVLSGEIRVTIQKTGDQTTVAQIGQILNQTLEYKANLQLRAEAISDKTVIPTLIISGIAFPLLGAYGALAVINAHYKNLMSLCAPIGIMNFLNIAAQRGILIKDGRTLDLLNEVDTIVFDKTGTLTEVQPTVASIHLCSSYKENELLLYAAAAERNQSHPIARAILDIAQARQLIIPEPDDVSYELGYGLRVYVAGRQVRVGSQRFIESAGIVIPVSMQQAQTNGYRQGHTIVFVALDHLLIGGIEIAPTPRPEAHEIIKVLRRRHNIKHMYIISGDHEIPTQKLAQDLGLENYFAETLPQNKAKLVEQLKDEGKFVCFVGDGINDAIALKSSHVSISLRGGSTVAKDTAQVVLMDQGLSHLPFLFDLAQNCQRNLNTTFALILSFTTLGMGGAFFLNFGLVHTITLNLISLTLGTANAMHPLLQRTASGSFPTQDEDTVETDSRLATSTNHPYQLHNGELSV
ncbi:MAG: heavy metal translocating P-type ATPase [Caldilineaceae bacterium]|nr:heavy metal translocating P-type ATPase [Caldilineaceae bacterium]